MPEFTDAPQRILVTGTAGTIGGLSARALQGRGHEVLGFDLHRGPEGVACMVGSIAEPAAVAEAMQGRETLLHFAAYPNHADFRDVLLEPNVLGLYTVVEAAVQAGVRRLILASSLQVTAERLRPHQGLG